MLFFFNDFATQCIITKHSNKFLHTYSLKCQFKPSLKPQYCNGGFE